MLSIVTWRSFIASSRHCRLRCCTVDFIRQQDVCEDWPLAEDKARLFLVEDVDTEHIARQEIARELYSTEFAPQ